MVALMLEFFNTSNFIQVVGYGLMLLFAVSNANEPRIRRVIYVSGFFLVVFVFFFWIISFEPSKGHVALGRVYCWLLRLTNYLIIFERLGRTGSYLVVLAIILLHSIATFVESALGSDVYLPILQSINLNVSVGETIESIYLRVPVIISGPASAGVFVGMFLWVSGLSNTRLSPLLFVALIATALFNGRTGLLIIGVVLCRDMALLYRRHVSRFLLVSMAMVLYINFYHGELLVYFLDRLNSQLLITDTADQFDSIIKVFNIAPMNGFGFYADYSQMDIGDSFFFHQCYLYGPIFATIFYFYSFTFLPSISIFNVIVITAILFKGDYLFARPFTILFSLMLIIKIEDRVSANTKIHQKVI